ncbi:MAG: N-acetylmannosamine-6-phosphate 2-epimerase [Sarcina sp.]
MKKEMILSKLKGNLIVSCQALDGEPLYIESDSIMYLMARAAKKGGAAAIRTNGVLDVISIKKETNLPIIGLIKKVYEGYEGYITPTMKEIDMLVKARADIIALDCTNRKRGDNKTSREFLSAIKEKYPDILIMADIATLEEGIEAQRAGCDFISTTLSGYTDYTEKTDGPDYKLVEELVKVLKTPIIAEGRIHTPEQAKKMLEIGAFAIVVGGAITRPLEITDRFVKVMKGEN